MKNEVPEVLLKQIQVPIFSFSLNNVIRKTSNEEKGDTVCALLALASINSWRLWQIDVKNAFLHGEIGREIYIANVRGSRARVIQTMYAS